jgi:2-haloacid dehalogenase
MSLDALLDEFGVKDVSEAERDHLNRAWHRLNPWPDSVEGLTRMKRRYVIGTLSNGNIALLTNMAKHAGLPWDCILSAENFRHYKPDPEAYLGTADTLGLKPHEVMLCAAHNSDLAAAKKQGLRTGFVARPSEYGPNQTRDLKAEQDWDAVGTDFVDLAKKLGA